MPLLRRPIFYSAHRPRRYTRLICDSPFLSASVALPRRRAFGEDAYFEDDEDDNSKPPAAAQQPAKRPAAEYNPFDDDSDDAGKPVGTAAGAARGNDDGSDEEEDPLDAFMADIDKQAKQDADTAGKVRSLSLLGPSWLDVLGLERLSVEAPRDGSRPDPISCPALLPASPGQEQAEPRRH